MVFTGDGKWEIVFIRSFSSRSLFFLKGLLVFSCLLVFSACGKKGPVRPLEQPTMMPPDNLSISQQGEHFLLSWTVPEGSEPAGLQGWRIYRTPFRIEEECPECREEPIPRLIVDLDYLRHARRLGDRIFIPDGELGLGWAYLYRVVPFDRSGREGPAESARRPFLPPPPRPQQVAAEGSDRIVRLSWEEAAPLQPDSEFLGYRILRRTEEEDRFPPFPLNDKPVSGTSFEDLGLENDIRYIYALRTIVTREGLTVESGLSETADAVPRELQ